MNELKASTTETGTDVVSVLLKQWKSLVVVAVVFGIAGLIYTIVVPAKWNATATLLFPLQAGGTPLVMSETTPMTVLKGIVKSQPLEDLVSERARVSRKFVADNLRVTERTPESQVRLDLSDDDANKALRVLTAAVSAIDILTKDNAVSVAQATYNSLKSALRDREAQLKEAEDRLTRFVLASKTRPSGDASFMSKVVSDLASNRARLDDVERQIKQMEDVSRLREQGGALLPSGMPQQQVPLREKLREKLILLELDLNNLSKSLGPSAPQRKLLEAEVGVAKGALEAESKREAESLRTNADVSMQRLRSEQSNLQWRIRTLQELNNVGPDESLQFQRLSREVTILNGLIVSLRQDVEKALLGADVARSQWSIYQPPVIEDDPVNKRYALNPAMFAALGMMGYSLLLVLREKQRSQHSVIS